MFRVFAGVVAISLLLPAAAPSRPGQDLLPIEILAPANGYVLTAGQPLVFRIRTHPGDTLWLHVSKSPAIADACGKIAADVGTYSFKATAADPSVYEEAPPVYSFSGYWMATPGTYYWQAYRIEYGGGADGCIETEMRSITVKAAPPKPPPPPPPPPAPKPKPAPAPKPAPKPPGALSAARLVGRFDVVERITSVSSFNEKVGNKDEGTWAFVPRCSRGACRTGLVFTVGFLSSHTIRIELTRSGATYAGHGSGALAKCMLTPVTGHIDVRLTVKKGAWISTAWRATRWTGTLKLSVNETVAGGFRCRAGSFTAAISGSPVT